MELSALANGANEAPQARTGSSTYSSLDPENQPQKGSNGFGDGDLDMNNDDTQSTQPPSWPPPPESPAPGAVEADRFVWYGKLAIALLLPVPFGLILGIAPKIANQYPLGPLVSGPLLIALIMFPVISFVLALRGRRSLYGKIALVLSTPFVVVDLWFYGWVLVHKIK